MTASGNDNGVLAESEPGTPADGGPASGQPSTREIADRFLAATSPGGDADPGLFDALLADDVTWELVGNGVEYARVYLGKAEVYGQYLGKLQQHLDSAKSEITTKDLFVDEAQGAIVAHNVDALALRDGGRINVEVVLIMRVRAGKIATITEVMDLRDVVGAFGASLDG
ncbi:nuclear transport factor 2 family protein [Dactylosporangium sp. CA-092794]|uniref:nuclear transport factor 2 family protein n=1 Tax=Dactylosporangium sp. CA-092794 TaxID=3239929 RepID=UPI003D8C49E5